MKSLLLLSCVVLVGACGSSSGTRMDGVQGLPLPSSGSQTPQPPSDSVPAVNPQQPSLGSTPAQTAATCSQVAAAATAAGCIITNSQMADCLEGTATGAVCGTEWKALLACLLTNATCGDNGNVNLGDSCPNEIEALDSCLTIGTPDCTAPTCDNCANACASCECAAAGSGIDCTTLCALVN